MWRWQHSWGGTYPKAGKRSEVWLCVQQERGKEGGWGWHWSLGRLNLLKTDRNRWVLLGQLGGGGGRTEPDLVSVQAEIGGKHTTQIRVSVQSQLVWLYYMQDIYFKLILVWFFLKLFLFLVCFSLFYFIIFKSFDWAGPQLVQQGVTSWGSRNKGTGEFFTAHLILILIFPHLLIWFTFCQ